jgi:hypothetical protein
VRLHYDCKPDSSKSELVALLLKKTLKVLLSSLISLLPTDQGSKVSVGSVQHLEASIGQ